MTPIHGFFIGIVLMLGWNWITKGDGVKYFDPMKQHNDNVRRRKQEQEKDDFTFLKFLQKWQSEK